MTEGVEHIRLTEGWRFRAGDLDTAAAAGPAFDDSGWREVTIPHDWSISGERRPDAPSAGGGGFFSTGIGWYRCRFTAPDRWQEQNVRIAFDGVYRRADVWLNGQHLGAHAYGYTPFGFELTPHLRIGDENVLAVRVDNSAQPNSRFYSGSGIFRPVWLHVADPVQLAPHGVTVSTADLQPQLATVAIRARVRNLTPARAAAEIDFAAIDPDGLPVASVAATGTIDAGAETETTRHLAIPHPRLWSPDSPALYRLVTRVFVDGRLADRAEMNFGVRTVAISAERGLEINGTPVELVGGNVHHDVGVLGAAAFDRAEERKAGLLKQAGFNAVRTAHNPPSTAFLDACDRLGLLVIDEVFDGWAKAKLPHDHHEDFAANWRDDVHAMIERDRHHPSVVMWSIGNEVYERGNASGRRLAREMADHVRALDPTRPVTIGLNGLGASGEWSELDPIFSAVDVAGYNYELAAQHADDHRRLPERIIYASESYLDETFRNWRIAHEQPYVIGDFVWSALDYLGEAGIGRVFAPGEKVLPHWEGDHFPWHGAACGDIDITGWRKPVSHYRAIVWDRGEKLYLAVRVPAPGGGVWQPSAWAVPPALPSWTWPQHEEQPLTVEVYSRCETVRLYLNNALIGEKPTGIEEEFRAEFEVPYAPGALRAVGLIDGKAVETRELITAGPPARLALTADRQHLRADGQDLAFVVVEVVDASGRRRFDADHRVTYAVEGPGEIAAIGSADLASPERYGANPRRVFQGRALVVVRTHNGHAGAITLTTRAEGLADASITLHSE